MHWIQGEELGMQVQSWRQSWSFSLPRRERSGLPHVGKVTLRYTYVVCPGSEGEAVKSSQRKRTPAEGKRNLEVTLRRKYWLMTQFRPDHPLKQLQWYPPIKFLQDLAFTQGFSAHSFVSVKAGGRKETQSIRWNKPRRSTGSKKRDRKLSLLKPNEHKNERNGTIGTEKSNVWAYIRVKN